MVESQAAAVGLALLSAVLTALSIVVDRVILNDVFDDPGSFLVTSKVSTVLVAVALGAVFAADFSPSMRSFGLIVVLGLFQAVPSYLYFKIIREADASVVSPIISTQPVVTVVLAVVLLGESLGLLEAGGIILILLGVMTLAVTRLRDAMFDFGGLRENVFFNRHAIWTFALTLVWAFEAILIKFVLGMANFWTVFLWANVVAVAIALPFVLRVQIREELVEAFSDERRAVSLLASELLGAASGLLMIAAYSFGRVSVIAPVLHTYSVFIFVFVILLHLSGVQIDTETSGSQLTRKALATVATLTGIAVLAIV